MSFIPNIFPAAPEAPETMSYVPNRARYGALGRATLSVLGERAPSWDAPDHWRIK